MIGVTRWREERALVTFGGWMAMPAAVLKASGQQRTLALTMTYAAVANLLLSIPGTKLYGVVGCAHATVPPALAAAAATFPRACRAVGLTLRRGYRDIVWPAAWPAVVVVAVLAEVRYAVPDRLAAVLALLAGGGLMYAAIFYRFGLPRRERQWYAAEVGEMWRRRSQGLAPA